MAAFCLKAHSAVFQNTILMLYMMSLLFSAPDLQAVSPALSFTLVIKEIALVIECRLLPATASCSCQCRKTRIAELRDIVIKAILAVRAWRVQVTHVRHATNTLYADIFLAVY